ncbi:MULTISPECIES: hypothetical protein [Staphylococcus]|uniref:hypothetical protein n=1 Tax=Staphylococcus TaxID=1279 RepID=UPI001AEC5001|nr:MULTISPECIES: hypothetical protein [Staphylococcus]WIL69109.1 hypothetical protein QMK35_10265 [Staphylococcus cohnii]
MSIEVMSFISNCIMIILNFIMVFLAYKGVVIPIRQEIEKSNSEKKKEKEKSEMALYSLDQIVDLRSYRLIDTFFSLNFYLNFNSIKDSDQRNTKALLENNVDHITEIITVFINHNLLNKVDEIHWKYKQFFSSNFNILTVEDIKLLTRRMEILQSVSVAIEDIYKVLLPNDLDNKDKNNIKDNINQIANSTLKKDELGKIKSCMSTFVTLDRFVENIGKINVPLKT